MYIGFRIQGSGFSEFGVEGEGGSTKYEGGKTCEARGGGAVISWGKSR